MGKALTIRHINLVAQDLWNWATLGKRDCLSIQISGGLNTDFLFNGISLI